MEWEETELSPELRALVEELHEEFRRIFGKKRYKARLRKSRS